MTYNSSQAVHVSSEAVSFDGIDSLTRQAEITLHLLPSPRIVIEVTFPEGAQVPAGVDKGVFSLKFPQRGFSAEVLAASIERSRISKVSAIAREEPIVIGPTGMVVEVEFRLLNLPGLYAFERRGEKDFVDRTVRIAVDEWCIEIEPTEDSSEAIESLKASGGYAFTHIGRLQRSDRQPFSISAATELLHAFYSFLSFARGFWISPALVFGIDSKGSRVWEEWGTRACSPWHVVDTWFDPRRANLLGEVFPRFWSCWRNPVWKQPLGLALYWYIGSNPSSCIKKPIRSEESLKGRTFALL